MNRWLSVWDQKLPSKARRSGFSLVEMLLVMVVSSVIALVSMKLILQSQSSASQSQQALDRHRAIVRFESQLRTDLRSATSIDLADPQSLVISCEATEITYLAKPEAIERHEIVDSNVPGNEAYFMPSVEVKFSAISDRQVEVVIQRVGLESSGRPLVIQQSVGRRR